MYSLEEIEYAWDKANIKGDWFDFMSYLGVNRKPDDLFAAMNIDEKPQFPEVKD